MRIQIHTLILLFVSGIAESSFLANGPKFSAFSKSRASSISLGVDIVSERGLTKLNVIREEKLPCRRNFINRGIAAVTASTIFRDSLLRPELANAAEEDIDVYFGCGCFWHVQHEFVEAEKRILGRSDQELTARAAYAGGKAGMLDGKVCYHNARNIADYGKLGHAEVVSLKIPPSKFKDFAIEYFNLFDKDGNRPDQNGDRGPEYRNVVGVPGGQNSEFTKELIAASIATGDKLDFAAGKGDDRDARKLSFVMDTAVFPSFVAEEYHQFHDGFNLNENYPKKYNELGSKYARAGESFGTCPNGSIGIGIGGL